MGHTIYNINTMWSLCYIYWDRLHYNPIIKILNNKTCSHLSRKHVCLCVPMRCIPNTQCCVTYRRFYVQCMPSWWSTRKCNFYYYFSSFFKRNEFNMKKLLPKIRNHYTYIIQFFFFTFLHHHLLPVSCCVLYIFLFFLLLLLLVCRCAYFFFTFFFSGDSRMFMCRFLCERGLKLEGTLPSFLNLV